MSEKPLIQVGVLGEARYQSLLLQAPELSLSSEARRYSFKASLIAASQARAFVLVYGATQTITPRFKSILLFASRFSVELVVLLVESEQIKSEDALDKIESNLRKNLSAQGFDGDRATILRATKAPSEATHQQLLRALDEREALVGPPPKRRAIPAEHPNRSFAELLLRLQPLALLSSEVAFEASTAEALYEAPISTQRGGIPYLEKGEEWPMCRLCVDTKLRFLWQIDARQHLPQERLGLFTFYYCNAIEHRGPDRFFIKHYPTTAPEKRRKMSAESKLKLFARGPMPAGRGRVTSIESLPSSQQIQDKATYRGVWSLLLENMPEKKFRYGYQKRRHEVEYYQQVALSLGAKVADFGEITPMFQIGGHCAPMRSLHNPECASCGKRMLTLAAILPSKDWQFNGDSSGLQGFVCPCNPNEVRLFTSAEDEYDLDEERYDTDWE